MASTYCVICKKNRKVKNVLVRLGLKGDKIKKVLADAVQCQTCKNLLNTTLRGLA